MKKTKRLLSLLLAMLMVLSLLAACGGGDKGGNTQGGGTNDTQNTTNNQGGGEDAAEPDDSGSAAEPADGEKVLRLTMSDTPETFNPQTTAGNYYENDKLSACLYGQVYDEASQSRVYVDQLADGDPYPVTDDFTVWQVKVKPGFTFVDGTPIDAHTFEYSMKVLNDPNLANRNVYASNLVGGEAYLLGEGAWEDVGFKAIDDYTLEVTYLPDYEPINAKDFKINFSFIGNAVVHPEMFESCLSADGTSTTYGTSMDTFVASGPYDLTGLIPGQFMEFTKRTDAGAPLTDVYTPDKVTWVAVTDSNTTVQLFEQGEIDTVVANQEAYNEYSGARYWYQKDNFGLYLNGETPTESALKDVNLRYALYWGLDRDTVVKAVYPISDPCAYQFMDFATMPDPADPENAVVDYRTTPEAQAIRIDGHPTTKNGYDKDLALEYFEKAYENNGSQKIEITCIYGDSGEVLKTWAEALQEHYNNLFGTDRFEITLQATPNSLLYELISREKMDFDMCCSCGWNMDPTQAWNNTNWVYSGPWTYNTQYCSIASEEARQEWDDIFYKCALYDYKRDDQKKLESMARLEEILLNDCCFVPCYFRGARYFFSSRINPIAQEGEPELGFALWQTRFN